MVPQDNNSATSFLDSLLATTQQPAAKMGNMEGAGNDSGDLFAMLGLSSDSQKPAGSASGGADMSTTDVNAMLDSILGGSTRATSAASSSVTSRASSHSRPSLYSIGIDSLDSSDADWGSFMHEMSQRDPSNTAHIQHAVSSNNLSHPSNMMDNSNWLSSMLYGGNSSSCSSSMPMPPLLEVGNMNGSGGMQIRGGMNCGMPSNMNCGMGGMNVSAMGMNNCGMYQNMDMGNVNCGGMNVNCGNAQMYQNSGDWNMGGMDSSSCYQNGQDSSAGVYKNPMAGAMGWENVNCGYSSDVSVGSVATVIKGGKGTRTVATVIKGGKGSSPRSKVAKGFGKRSPGRDQLALTTGAKGFGKRSPGRDQLALTTGAGEDKRKKQKKKNLNRMLKRLPLQIAYAEKQKQIFEEGAAVDVNSAPGTPQTEGLDLISFINAATADWSCVPVDLQEEPAAKRARTEDADSTPSSATATPRSSQGNGFDFDKSPRFGIDISGESTTCADSEGSDASSFFGDDTRANSIANSPDAIMQDLPEAVKLQGLLGFSLNFPKNTQDGVSPASTERTDSTEMSTEDSMFNDGSIPIVV